MNEPEILNKADDCPTELISNYGVAVSKSTAQHLLLMHTRIYIYGGTELVLLEGSRFFVYFHHLNSIITYLTGLCQNSVERAYLPAGRRPRSLDEDDTDWGSVSIQILVAVLVAYGIAVLTAVQQQC
jgi:hypothetical protein